MNTATLEVIEVDTGLVYANSQDRKDFAEGPLQELIASIRDHGLAQPPTVRPDGAGRYVIVAGERRFRAVTALGWPKMPVIVRQMDDDQASDVQLIENVNRADLDPFEEAVAYRSRMERFGLTEEKVAERYGKPVAVVKKRLELLQLDDKYRALVRTGELSVSHAGAMARLDSNRQALAFKAHQEAKGMTMWQFSKLCDQLYGEQQADSMFDPDQFLKVQELVETAKKTALVTGRDLVHLVVDLADLIIPITDDLLALGVPEEKLQTMLDMAEQVRTTRVTGKGKARTSGARPTRKRAPRVA